MSLALQRINPIRALRGLIRWTFESWEEWRYGIYTEASIGIKEFGITDPSCYHYVPSSYMRFRQVMKHVKIRPGKDVFADMGSGLGRVVILAASYPFRKVIGVEISKELDAIARENVRKSQPRLTCKNIELQCVDVRDFKIPPDLTMVYFWSPFDETVLSHVFANLRRSVEECPRELTIIYTEPPEDRCLEKIKPELGWLTEVENIALSSHVSMVIHKYIPVTG